MPYHQKKPWIVFKGVVTWNSLGMESQIKKNKNKHFHGVLGVVTVTIYELVIKKVTLIPVTFDCIKLMVYSETCLYCSRFYLCSLITYGYSRWKKILDFFFWPQSCAVKHLISKFRTVSSLTPVSEHVKVFLCPHSTYCLFIFKYLLLNYHYTLIDTSTLIPIVSIVLSCGPWCFIHFQIMLLFKNFP